MILILGDFSLFIHLVTDLWCRFEVIFILLVLFVDIDVFDQSIIGSPFKAIALVSTFLVTANHAVDAVKTAASVKMVILVAARIFFADDVSFFIWRMFQGKGLSIYKIL